MRMQHEKKGANFGLIQAGAHASIYKPHTERALRGKCKPGGNPLVWCAPRARCPYGAQVVPFRGLQVGL